jgi:hypothetical protein
MAPTCLPQTFASNARLACRRRALLRIDRAKVMHQNNRILAQQGKENACLRNISLRAAINMLALKAAPA